MTQTVFNYMHLRISLKREAAKNSTADNYRATCNHLLLFTGKVDFSWDEITPAHVDRFAESLLGDHLAVNTVNSYLSCYRAIYHAAQRDELFPPRKDPFSHLSLKREETPKRALKMKGINKLMQANYAPKSRLQQALDLFIFCFLASGMPFVDLAYLTKKNIVGNEIVYHRHKTGTLVRVAITPAMRLLLRKYAKKGSPYLFPVLAKGNDGHEVYKAALRRQNRLLKKIGKSLRLPGKLTTYVARHSWATEALRKNIPVAVISQALGHKSEKTTRIYLASLDQSILNRANKKVTKKVDQMVMERA